MAVSIERNFKFKPAAQLSLTTSLGTTPPIPMEGFAGGTIYIPSGSPITTLTWYGSPRDSSSQDPLTPASNTQPAPTFYPLHTNDSLDTAETLTVSAGNCYNLPADVFGFGALKITVNSAGQVELSMKG